MPRSKSGQRRTASTADSRGLRVLACAKEWCDDATAAADRPIVPGKAVFIIPPPAATNTRKKVPRSSEKRRRHSRRGSLKFWVRSRASRSPRATEPQWETSCRGLILATPLRSMATTGDSLTRVATAVLGYRRSVVFLSPDYVVASRHRGIRDVAQALSVIACW